MGNQDYVDGATAAKEGWIRQLSNEKSMTVLEGREWLRQTMQAQALRIAGVTFEGRQELIAKLQPGMFPCLLPYNKCQQAYCPTYFALKQSCFIVEGGLLCRWGFVHVFMHHSDKHFQTVLLEVDTFLAWCRSGADAGEGAHQRVRPQRHPSDDNVWRCAGLCAPRADWPLPL